MFYYSLGSALGSLLFALIFLSFYYLDKKRAPLILSLAFFTFAMYYGVAASIIHHPLSSHLYILYYLFHLLGISLILLGSAKLLQQEIPSRWYTLGLLTGILFTIGWFFFLENPLLYLAILFILSLFYIRGGILYLQSSMKLMASVFLLLGFSLFLSFFFMERPWYSYWIIGTTSLGFLMSMGIIILYFQDLIQERDRIAKELKEESSRLSVTLKSICDGIIVTDRRGLVILVNEMAYTITGFKEEESLQKKVYTLLPLKDREGREFFDPVQQVLKTKREVLIEETLLKDREGKEKVLSCSATPIFQEEGGVHGILLTLRDITHLKETERILQESERRYRSFVESFQGIAYRAEPGFKPIFFHGQVEKMTGYTSDDFLEERVFWNQLIHPEDREIPGEVPPSGLKGHEKVEEEIIYRIFTRDGRVRWVKEFRSISTAEREPCYQGFIYDITLWMQAEEQLKEAHYQLNSIIESSPLGIISLNKRFCITSWNPAASAIFGFQEEEVMGKRIYSLIPYLKERFSIIKEWVKKGEILEGEEMEIRRKDNQKLMISLSAAPLKKTREGYVGIMAVFMDITHQKKAERLLKENLKQARYLQESLLSRDLPALSSINVSAANVPASHVSGDYYNAYLIGSTQVILVADVSGHGVDAALITVFISSFFQRELGEDCVSKTPIELLESFRKEFTRQGFPDDYAVDLFIGFLEESTYELHYAVAGSIRSLMITDTKRETLSKSSGMPINNTITSPILGSGTIHLEPGETLLVYTDGLDEPFLIREEPIPFFETLTSWYERLLLEELLERILSDSLRVMGKDAPDDDMTILALSISSSTQRGEERDSQG